MPAAEIQRIVLIVALIVAGYLMMLAWQADYGGQEAAPSTPPVVTPAPVDDAPPSVAEAAPAPLPMEVPQAPAMPAETAPPQAASAPVAADRLITVETRAMSLWIDRLGGDIVGVRLPRYPVTLEQPDIPFVLLDRRPGHVYVAQSGLVGRDGPDGSGERPLFRAAANAYRFTDEPGQVTLLHEDGGIEVEKRFRFEPDDYHVELEYVVENRRSAPFAANLFAQIKRDASVPESAEGMSLGPRPYLGAALTTVESRYEKVDFDDLDDEPFSHEVAGGWIAVLQHYFLSAWVAEPGAVNHFYGYPNRRGDGTYIVGFTGPAFEVPPGGQGGATAGFYAGPKDQRRLAEIAPHLNLTVDYGFLWWLAVPLFRLLEAIHSVMANWGVAIILMTLVIKIVLYPLSAASYRSMAKMRKLTPQLKRLQERHAGDRQKLSQEMMELYRKEKANPLGGCLPMLLQMPVFIALYWVLYESVELRQAPFIGWIDDLAAMDPFFVLPILMGVSMYGQQLLNPPLPDPMQARIMKMMPIMFTVLFLFFPAGLVLYWLVNNLLSMAQQWFITYRIEKMDTARADA